MSGNKQDTSVGTFYVLVVLGIACWVAPSAWKPWIIFAMLSTVFIRSHVEIKVPKALVEPPSVIEQPINKILSKPTQPIELPPPLLKLHPVEPLPFKSIQPVEPPLRFNSQSFEPPVINYLDVDQKVKTAAYKAAKKVVFDGLKSGESVNATESFARKKALIAAKETNKRLGNLLQATEISAIANAATEEALRQNNSNRQQG